ncbi:Hypothetical predicted protein [Lecanosticta acicola]|uniref:SET domain-containing protein n=1 Tax=Lecanosticta acicola TaxID=111012 RepID=A0AAI8YWK3_9PEZI|nr:Hypothetical predicted protein [Lecanosticta acicola]
MTQLNGAANGTSATVTVTVPVPVPVSDLHSTESEYDLTVNDLEKLVSLVHTPAGLCVVSNVSRPAGAHFAYITRHVPRAAPTWKTIQTSTTTHTDPTSALLYMNHACQPSLEVHTFAPDPATGTYPLSPPAGNRNGEILDVDPARGLAGEVTVARDRGLEPGDPLTFFYPSTEWKFDRPFDCLCGAPPDVCLGTVQGASVLSRKDLDRWFFNEHIWQLADKRDAVAS